MAPEAKGSSPLTRPCPDGEAVNMAVRKTVTREFESLSGLNNLGLEV